MPNLNGAVWRKSSRSHEQGQCVELALNLPGVAAVRDSKTPEQDALVFTKAQLQTFLATIKSGRLDL
ncbi:DUF397 domain-containing protein [Saccharopolyspora shandongensis]|uniref:DUF397 domain-containing protein n=1 Tax=Saccharopolyspora shandongensis TaxID=418495 RepID=UPI0033DD2440